MFCFWCSSFSYKTVLVLLNKLRLQRQKPLTISLDVQDISNSETPGRILAQLEIIHCVVVVMTILPLYVTFIIGDHNFCRNPDNRLQAPWCFTDAELVVEETCAVTPCDGIIRLHFSSLLPCLKYQH